MKRNLFAFFVGVIAAMGLITAIVANGAWTVSQSRPVPPNVPVQRAAKLRLVPNACPCEPSCNCDGQCQCEGKR